MHRVKGLMLSLSAWVVMMLLLLSLVLSLVVGEVEISRLEARSYIYVEEVRSRICQKLFIAFVQFKSIQ